MARLGMAKAFRAGRKVRVDLVCGQPAVSGNQDKNKQRTKTNTPAW